MTKRYHVPTSPRVFDDRQPCERCWIVWALLIGFYLLLVLTK